MTPTAAQSRAVGALLKGRELDSRLRLLITAGEDPDRCLRVSAGDRWSVEHFLITPAGTVMTAGSAR